MGDHAETVVERVLEYRPRAASHLRAALNRAIDTTVKVHGYRAGHASKADDKRLAASILRSMDRCDNRLASAVLDVWDESQPQLRERVETHLRQSGVGIQERGANRTGFEMDWRKEEWHEICAAVANNEADEAICDDIRLDDIRLMVCWVAGRLPCRDVPAVESPRFQRWLEELEKLPSDAREWADAKQFADCVKGIADAKADEFVNRHMTALKDSIDQVHARFKDELRYLDVDVATWFKAAEKLPLAVPEAQALVAAMKKALAEYEKLRPQAPSLEKEKRRVAMRSQCEERFFGLVRDWRELMARQPAPNAVREPAGKYRTDAEDDVSSEPMEPLAANNKMLENELESLKIDNASLQTKVDGGTLERAQLNDAIGQLKCELAQQREAEQYWRQAYVAAKRPETEADAPVAFASVADAVLRAKETFDNELLFALNGKSSKNCPFQKPDEVYEALAWLATEFHRRRPGCGSNPDFDRLIRETCSGWSYKPNQTETTMGKYSEWYQATVGGRTYELSAHIGKGNSFDPKNTIRIAFAWDDDSNRVVIGYIGHHQRNRRS